VYKCEKSSRLAAKVSQEINNIPTCRIFFLSYLACISADYAFILKMNVIALSADFSIISSGKTAWFQTIFLPHLYSPFHPAVLIFYARKIVIHPYSHLCIGERN
jgi:hypothetical protein